MAFGAQPLPDGGVRFRLWAPAHERIGLAFEPAGHVVAMTSLGDGWHELESREAGAGTRYRFVLPDGMRVPDPASRFQPEDVHGPSEVIDPAAFAWTDGGWLGRPWHETVLYELHVGAFTDAGTFAAAIGKLDHLATLGVTAIELMPIADFAGGRNWGYDGVLFYAPESSYGRPEDLKALVQAAHARGIMVMLDAELLHRAAPHAMGCRDQLRRQDQPAGARIRHPERAVLDRGISL
jgi:malto-oligosyltrehalose trehalohydrolase